MALNIPWDLFKKYLLKSIADDEMTVLHQWRSQAELNDTIYLEILDNKQIQDALLTGKWENHVQEWKKLADHIKTPIRQITFTRKKFYAIISAAASILILIGFALGSLHIRHDPVQLVEEDNYTSIFSPRGQRTKVILPDNSLVWLNGGSSIRYATSYNLNQREIFLSGEAFFEVEKSASRPFFVNAGEIKIRVYGTSFNVKAFPNENTIETTLIEGKLSIIPMDSMNQPGKEIYLKPNEKCLIEKCSLEPVADKLSSASDGITNDNESMQKKIKALKPRITVKHNINPDREKLWKEGILIFRNESYSDLATELERWYDVKIHFKDENIRNFKFTGSFEKETIDQAMEALRLSSQKSYQYEIVFRDIYLTTQ